jgi:hypothetical protein
VLCCVVLCCVMLCCVVLFRVVCSVLSCCFLSSHLFINQEIVARNPNNGNAQDQDPQNCAKLNAGSRYFDGGVVEISTSGSFKYISSRNNNFSNRSQKAVSWC